jgi:uncharacterized protein
MRDKVVVITGASSGFGKLAALEAGRRGYKVVVTARRAEQLQHVANEIENGGGAALAIAGDINDDAHQQRVIDQTLARFGRIDVLVNNAGIPLATRYAEASVDELRRQWNTNTLAIVTLTRRMLPELIQRQGTVINVTSSISRFSIPGWGLYAPSKVAATSISDALRRELAPLGVRVCTVEPGPYNTEFEQHTGRNSDLPFGFDPQPVAHAIVRLIEHPRRLTVLPLWFRPLIAIGGGLMRALPDVVDLVFLLQGRLRGRRSSPPSQDVVSDSR